MISIRPVRPDEWSQLQILNNEVFIDNAKYDEDLVEDWALSPKGKEYFQEVVNNPKDICFVAENEQEQLIGYIAASPKEIDYRKSKYLEIDNMGVIPEYRSQGIGKMLMDACIQEAKSRGFNRAFVNAYWNNKKAIAFYKKKGFKEIDVGLEQIL